MPSAPPIIDGVLARKDHRGTWAKRYFRTHKYNLNYYTSNLSAIEKSFDASGEHFKYKAIGSPTEVFRLELLLKVEKREGNVFYFEIEDPDDDEIEEFELRCSDEKAAARWVEAIEELAKRANEDKLRIGTLHIEVDGGFLIGKHAARSPTVRLELDFPARDAIDVIPEVAATSEDATSKVDADLLYENLDEADDAVARCPALRLDAHLPCHASSAKFVLALVEDAEAHAAATSPEVTGERSPTERLLGADLSCADQNALADAQHSFHSAIGKHVYGDSLEASRVAPEDDAEAEPAKLQGVVLAKRVGHLFELQEQRAIWVSQMVGSLPEASGFGRSAIDGGRENDQVGPDGSKPSKPGYKWYALLDDKGEKVAAVLHAHVWFAEDPIAVVDGALERLECPDHESAGFDTAVLQSAIDRASTVLASLQLIGKALDDFTHWVEPRKTAAIYALMVYLAWRWPHAGMAYFPVGMLLPILYAAPPRVRRALGKPSEAESSADGRGVATCRVAVLEARGLAAADDNITTEASSDPYVAIVTAPGEPPPEVAEARTPTLVGVTESIYGIEPRGGQRPPRVRAEARLLVRELRRDRLRPVDRRLRLAPLPLPQPAAGVGAQGRRAERRPERRAAPSGRAAELRMLRGVLRVRRRRRVGDRARERPRRGRQDVAGPRDVLDARAGARHVRQQRLRAPQPEPPVRGRRRHRPREALVARRRRRRPRLPRLGGAVDARVRGAAELLEAHGRVAAPAAAALPAPLLAARVRARARARVGAGIGARVRGRGAVRGAGPCSVTHVNQSSR